MNYILILLGIALASFLLRIGDRKAKLDSSELGGTGNPVTKEATQEWYNLSWNGKDPLRVIRLAADMSLEMNKFDAHKHLASSFYSQVKYLVKKGRLPTAIAFFIEARQWAKSALQHRKEVPRENRNPIDLEVLGAPDFMLAKMPYIGWIIGHLGFWTSAIEFLNAADIELEMKLKEPGTARPEPITAGLVWSKLYALTGDEYYKNRVRIAELTRDHDINQMKRIAKHLGFKTLEELDEFLII